MAPPLQIRVVTSVDEIDANSWDRLLRRSETADRNCETDQTNPFMRYAFLSALEKSGSAEANTGWLGQHLLLESEDGELIGALPCYLKNHSQGEYVFDHGWADAFERAGGRYYPKLQCSVPFTPATGPRLLAANNSDSEQYKLALLKGLETLGQKHNISSAHITALHGLDAGPFTGFLQ